MVFEILEKRSEQSRSYCPKSYINTFFTSDDVRVMTDPHSFRLQCREENYQSSTSGVCAGYAQANLIVLPKELARNFEDLCFRNPVACPLLTKTIDKSTVVDRRIISDEDFDVTTDLPKYNIYQNGELVKTATNITQEWTDNHVGFLIGCSFTFEDDLLKSGLVPKHQEQGRNVLMYSTTKNLNNTGVFVGCCYVVSMRPYKVSDVNKVRDISRQYKRTHGEPIDWGYDAVQRLGIKDLKKPEFGDPIEIAQDEIPVFWGCGVTPQAAVLSLGDKIEGTVMAHAPGHMLILDATNAIAREL